MTFGKIGAKKMMHEWHNPYVTNGLVAMWDGQWNAGGGIHDADAIVWKDLVGSNDVTLDSDVVWQSNCTVQSKTYPTATRENSVVSWAFAEVACDWSLIAGTWNTAAFFSAGSSVTNDMPCMYGNGPAYVDSGKTKFFCTFIPTGRSTKYAEIESLVSDQSALCGTLSFDKTNKIVWKDAHQLTMSDQSTPYLYNTTGSIFIGSNHANGERGFKGKFYCIRLYSCILTQEQIAANYAIDSKRFNLSGGGYKCVVLLIAFSQCSRSARPSRLWKEAA